MKFIHFQTLQLTLSSCTPKMSKALAKTFASKRMSMCASHKFLMQQWHTWSPTSPSSGALSRKYYAFDVKRMRCNSNGVLSFR